MHNHVRTHTHEQDVKRLQELKERILDGEALGEGGKVKKRIKIGGRFVSNAMRRSAKRSLLRGNREGEGCGEGGVWFGGEEIERASERRERKTETEEVGRGRKREIEDLLRARDGLA